MSAKLNCNHFTIRVSQVIMPLYLKLTLRCVSSVSQYNQGVRRKYYLHLIFLALSLDFL